MDSPLKPRYQIGSRIGYLQVIEVGEHRHIAGQRGKSWHYICRCTFNGCGNLEEISQKKLVSNKGRRRCLACKDRKREARLAKPPSRKLDFARLALLSPEMRAILEDFRWNTRKRTRDA